MKNDRRKSSKPALIQRKLIRQCITIAVLSVVITGCLTAFFYTGNMAKHDNVLLKSQMNNVIPGLFDILVIILISLVLSLSIGCLVFRKSIILRNSNNLSNVRQNIPETYPDETHRQDADLNTTNLLEETHKKLNSDDTLQLKDALETEKHWNSLMFAMLCKDDARHDNILGIVNNFCKSDYSGFYNKPNTSGSYSRYTFHDSNPALARHSQKVDVLDSNQYQWMMHNLSANKPFVFDKAKMDALIESLNDNDNDAKTWMQTQAKDIAEYKLCVNEGWSYFVSVPYVVDNGLSGFFLLGYHSSPLPLSTDMIVRLSSISNVLADKILKISTLESPANSTGSMDAVCANIRDAIFVTDIDGKITWANPATEGLCGLAIDDIINKQWYEIFHLVDSDSKAQTADPLIAGKFRSNCYTIPNNVVNLTQEDFEIPVEGMISRVIDSKSNSLGFVFMIRDKSDRIEEFNEIIKCQKAEAISSLSAGLAHDFNNLLTAILGNISLVLDDLPPDSEHAISLKAAEECTMKGKDITNRLLTFAKSSPQDDTVIETSANLERIVSECSKDSAISPIFNLEPDLPEIKISLANFESVIVNLINNAIQAMSLVGELRITAKSVDNTNGSIAMLNKYKYVCIHIIDTGDGIPNENMSRIFTPYFSTREGRSGLGLASVNSILIKHSGTIKIQSTPGMGTDCEIYLPAVESSGTINSGNADDANKHNTLVLDEDDMLGNLLVKTLSKMDIKVDKTSSPNEIISVFTALAKQSRPANLVILNLDIQTDTDLNNLAFQLKKISNAVKIIAYSRHIQSDDILEYKLKGFDDILHKPFNISDLKTLIIRNLES